MRKRRPRSQRKGRVVAKPNAKAPLGQGGRFAALKQKIQKSGKPADSAAAIAASVGRKKYGAGKMASMAAKGKK